MPANGAWLARLRSVVTMLLVSSVVIGEFFILSYVYQRPAPIHHQRLTQSNLQGLVNGVRRADPELVSAVTLRVQLLSTEGVSSADLRAVRHANATLAARPTSEAALSDLRSADASLGIKLEARQRRIDDEATALYVILLALASVGWFGWFSTVVKRQRRLERAVTEQTSQAEAEAKLAALVRNASDVIAVVDSTATISYVSPSAAKVLGLPATELLTTKLTDLLHPDDVDHLCQVLATISPGAEQPLSIRVCLVGDEQIYVEGEVRNLLDDPAVGGLVVTVRDVSQRRLLEEQLSHQALHDSLTGLANRRLLADRLAHSLERRGDRMQAQVVLFIDLDDFKTVNDSLGHGVGDEVLSLVGSTIRGLVRAGDTAARVGGDEFAVLMEGATLAEAQLAADRLIEAISAPMRVGEVTIQITASIGIAYAIPGEVSAADALRNADLAMYWAKDSGKATAAVYETRLHTEALERMQLRADLQRAIHNDELVLHYQPEINLATGAIAGVEALIRWQHPIAGLMPPIRFIPMAEETGLIVEIDKWVISNACRTAGELRDDPRGLTMAVNVSAAYFDHADLVPTVAAAIREHDVNPGQLVLEITESALLQDIDAVVPRLRALRDMGVRIAIDDFGTGYSSLAYLSNLRVDILKIDKSFVDQVMLDRQHASITEAIIAMGQSLRLQTIAEGVEDEGQANWLRDAGCTLGQGYVWSRPIDRDALREVLADGLGLGAPRPPASAASHQRV
jgi:diguanylate cyclase (GGDEF)-like protein/PAS domain S-box-containing protein